MSWKFVGESLARQSLNFTVFNLCGSLLYLQRPHGIYPRPHRIVQTLEQLFSQHCAHFRRKGQCCCHYVVISSSHRRNIECHFRRVNQGAFATFEGHSWPFPLAHPHFTAIDYNFPTVEVALAAAGAVDPTGDPDHAR
jgi:hypothetical protein